MLKEKISGRKLIICSSFLNIPKVISIVCNDSRDNVVFIVMEDNLFTFLKYYYSDYPIFHVKENFENLYSKNILNFINEKINLKKRLKNASSCEVWFFSNAYNYLECFIVKRLSGNNSVMYLPDVDISFYKSVFTIKTILKVVKIRILYGIWTYPRKIGRGIAYTVSNRFIKRNRITLVERENPTIEPDAYFEKEFDLEGASILFLTGNIIESGLVEKEEYIKKTDEILCFLETQYGKENIRIKCHPRVGDLYSKEKEYKSIDKNIPANILFPYFNVVIGFSSGTLFEAVNAGVSGISTMDYYTLTDGNIKSDLKEYLQRNCAVKDRTIDYFSDLKTLKNKVDEIRDNESSAS